MWWKILLALFLVICVIAGIVYFIRSLVEFVAKDNLAANDYLDWHKPEK